MVSTHARRTSLFKDYIDTREPLELQTHI
uniref:Uncharacterized protein n=1 Tax=Arundo donax TaxID=35708 RepID=A0A0A9EC85_ARUDO